METGLGASVTSEYVAAAWEEPCGYCHATITLSAAQRRWKRCHPDRHVFCGTQCCNRHYQQKRRETPEARKAEYQRYVKQRNGTLHDVPGVIHVTDQDYLGGGWSWVPLPSYGAYRCTCRPKQECAACRAWRG